MAHPDAPARAQMGIGPRLATGFAVVLLFLAAVVGVAVNRLDLLATTTRQVVEGDAARAALAASINLHAESAAGRLLLLFILKDRDQRSAVYGEIDRHNSALDAQLEHLAGLLGDPAEQAGLTRLEALRKTYHEKFFETVDAIEAGERENAERLMTGPTRIALNDLLKEAAQLAERQQASMAARQADAVTVAVRSRYWVIGLGLAALVAGLLLAGLLTRGIAVPLCSAVRVADAIGSGQLGGEIPPGGGDEVGQLLNRMADMQARLREVIGTIRSSANQVRHAADGLETPAGDVRNGSHAQCEMAGRIDASVGQLGTGIGQIVSAAQTTRGHAAAARDLARDSAALIGTAAREIAAIAQTVTASANAVETLRTRAEEVAGTVHVIKEIADQTNLLALNASIEAARAGESGRGFAVVADEVRKLSARTAEATVQIGAVIASIDAQTLQAVDSIHSGRSGMERGMGLIQGIVAPLDELCRGAQSSLDNLETLSSVAESQLHDSAAIADNVHRIVTMAEGNRQAAHALAEITAELALLAQRLQDAVDTFQL